MSPIPARLLVIAAVTAGAAGTPAAAAVPRPAAAQAAAAPAPYPVGADVEAGVREVRARVEGVIAGPGGERERATTLAAVSWVQAHVSPELVARAAAAPDDITARAGLCGAMVETFMQIVQRLGVRVLPVQFFFNRGEQRSSHVAAEVRWGGRWRYVDPTWGTLFETPGRGVLSLDQVLELRDPGRYALMNRLAPWTDANLRRGGGWDPLGYLRGTRGRTVISGGDGRIALPAVATATGARFALAFAPDYVGRLAPYAHQLVDVQHVVEVPRGLRTLTVTARVATCGGPGSLVAHTAAGTVRAGLTAVRDGGSLRLALPASGRVVLDTTGGDPTQSCALVLSDLRAGR